MDKKLALENVGFVYINGKYKIELCTSENGTRYVLTCDLGKAGYIIETTHPDGREDSNGAGKFKNTPIWDKMSEIISAYEDQMNDTAGNQPSVKTWQEPVQEAVYEEAEPVRMIQKQKPRRTIRGLTPRLAECGKIKIGRKGEMKTSQKGNSFRPPEKIDHFIVTTMEKVNDDFAPDAVIMKKLGDSCKEIHVRLPYDDPSLNFPTSYAYYDSAACQCRGDGETAITSTGECIECNPDTCINIKDKKCKANGVLSVILDDAPRVGGVYKFRTTGWNSINNIFSSMEFIRGLTNGLLACLPLVLTLTPKHTVIPGTKTQTTIYMVNLEFRGSLQDMVTAIQQTMNTRVSMQYSIKDFEKLAEVTLSLPESQEDCKSIAEEFYPESIGGI
jgi:Recombination directionality factor-like